MSISSRACRIWSLFNNYRRGYGRNVFISHHELVHPEAKITNSKIHGRVHVGKNSIIKDCFISARELHIGRNTSLWGPSIDIHSRLNTVIIGNFCSIARNVTMQEYNHRLDRCSTYFFSHRVFEEGVENDIMSRGPIIIGNDVWIASHVVIGSGATIGNGAVVGANSLVLSDIPPYAVVAGSPAKVLRYRFDENIVERLTSLKWWEWNDERILQNRELFVEPLTTDVLDRIV